MDEKRKAFFEWTFPFVHRFDVCLVLKLYKFRINGSESRERPILANIFCNWNTHAHTRVHTCITRCCAICASSVDDVVSGSLFVGKTKTSTARLHCSETAAMFLIHQRVNAEHKWTTEQSSFFYRLTRIQHIFVVGDHFRILLVSLEHELTIEHKYFNFRLASSPSSIETIFIRASLCQLCRFTFSGAIDPFVSIVTVRMDENCSDRHTFASRCTFRWIVKYIY